MKIITGLLGIALLCVAAEKKPPAAQAENEKVSISATLMADKESVARELGSDLGGHITVVRVEVTPKTAEPLALNREDFLLRSSKDGQRSGPLHPSQIAGRAALVVTSRPGGAIAAEQGGPIWGPGPGGTGRPQRLPGSQGAMGTSTAGVSEAQATMNTGNKQKEDPVLTVLKEKVLPDKETKDPVSGLLYFSLEGKHKPKQLALQYDGPAGKLRLEFR